ncbi:MAG TPA: ABC transporter permease, partial [Gemmatimonadaceae bacterium]|nr:ABC transporter permease [Gemmatimonadaceae bacterium]
MRSLVRRDAVERDMNDEMRLHLERAVERLVERGLSPADARAEARREFGNVGYIQEEARDARGVRWIDEILRDVRYAIRGLRRKPGFALAVITTLALGIGANATMFGIVDRLLFRPPNYLAAPDRSHRIYFARFIDGSERFGQSFQYQRFLDLRRSSTTMEALAAYSARRLAVGSGENSREIRVGAASASLWHLFDARPVIGRFFTVDEDGEPNGARVVVLSFGYWESQYASSHAVLGTTITIGPASYTVIGVAPRGFAGVQLETPDAFIPIGMAAVDDLGSDWTRERATYALNWLELYGRRKPGVTVEGANADLSAALRESYLKQIALDLRAAPIGILKPRVVLGSVLAERGPRRSADARVATWLLGVTGIVLLIACANVGNLLLASALGRRREIAVRVALGVSRGRLIGQLLIESMTLAALGAFAGLVLTQSGGQLLRRVLLPSVDW